MIRVIVSGLLVGLCIASMGYASPIVVRSGDHEGFTRLVMQLPNDADWQVTENPGLKIVTISDHSEGFDINRVFDVIPRDQLTSVRSYPSRLELEVSCACGINTFMERGRFLVIDILDGPPLPPMIRADAARFITARPASRFNFGDLLWSEFASEDDDDSESQLTESPQTDVASGSSAVTDIETTLIEETRTELLRGLSNATSRGILEPATPDLGGLLNDTTEPTEQDIYDSSEEIVSEASPKTGNIRITSSHDTPTSFHDSGFMTSGAVCPDPATVKVSTWGSDKPFHLQVAELRRELFSEFDRLDQDIALQLARSYIFFGFGAEAKQVLRLSDDLLTTNPELFDLASIMEHGFAVNPRFVHQFADCDSDLALWAAMAAKELSPDQILNEAAALRALASLPDHVKRFVAPALSQRLADRGDLDSASIALRNLEWNEDSQSSSTELAQAVIEKQHGNRDRAEKILSAVVASNTPETPEAMIAFVESRLKDGDAIPADIALLIETYAFELRDSPIAKDIHRTHVIASAYSGQFSKAFDAMRSDLVSEDPELTAELLSHIFSALSSSADDVTFLEAFFSQFPSTPAALTNKATKLTTSRLLELGFSTEAESILAELPSNQKDDDLRMLHAESLVAMQQPEAALTILDLVEADQSDDVRARALSQLGENEQAFELFQTLNSEDAAVRSAWLASEWTEIMPPETPVFGSARSLAEEIVPTVRPRDGMLESIGAAVEQSTSARSALQDLLDRVPVDR
ncbi:hypothetical protein [uncultured Roseobacter sp.]|uniref:hypothetical protein n=1 Tax=uncultured Roseobacter sp. TaxID=114847 RepID=UPI00261A0782|nr:hypothetical protein [uncultured Roseobacter sp.]